MQIKWQGHACFYIIGSDVRIVTDPYTPDIAGLAPLSEPADVVVMSSDNDTFHSNAEGVPGNPVIVNALVVAREGGSRDVNGLHVRAIEAMESLIHKLHPDNNAMFRFEVDGVHVGHMGDVGNPLTQTQRDFFRGVDVLLVLTGGPPTIELNDLDDVIRDVQPKVVIPMHYQVPNLRLNILGVEAFTSRYRADIIKQPGESIVELNNDSLPQHMHIIVLQPAANTPN